MKFKIQKHYSLVLAFIMVLVSSCEITDLDINTDPNNASEASLNLLLTGSLYDGLDTFASGLNDTTMGFQAINTSSDDFNFTNSSWNGTWNFLYSGPLKDLEEIIVAADPEVNPHYLGIAQIMKAYYFTTMVDLWGDVPYSEAFQGNGEEPNTEPAYDSGASIYADAFVLIDQAITNLAKSQGVSIKGDILYGGNTTKWRKAAKSLKLKLLINTRNVDSNAGAIQSLISEGDLILSSSDDFQLRFSALKNPDNRHPMYQSGYAGGEAGYSYFGHQLMYEMLSSKDPRTPFYFKRQTSNVLDPEDPTAKQTIPCSQRDDCVYNYFVTSSKVTNGVFGVDPDALSDSQQSYLAGFFGRDRSDPSGIPNDNPIRTTVGAYPAAGLFDVSASQTGGNKFGTGDGIFPIISSWMVKFWMLEAQIALDVNTGYTEADLMAEAIGDQIDKVISVGTAADPQASSDIASWPTEYNWPIVFNTKTDYIDNISSDYPADGSDNLRLNFALKQAWFANFGNGFEGYNSFRRTGYPSDIQAPLQLIRQYALSLPYAQDEINLNPNTPQKAYDSPSSAVFWDTLKFQF
tara:strand:- start:1216 stop:2940 length:1725 start_codon:yes stop_codon:yes gene_type:complete